jgi:hypothetical protein
MNDTERPISSIDHVATIWERCQQRTVSEFALYDACALANADWSNTAKPDLLKQLPFSPAKFSKYAQIGADERLKDPRRRELLPPKYSIIYEVHLLNDEELESLESAGKLTQSLRRAEVISFRKSAAKATTPTEATGQLAETFADEAANTTDPCILQVDASALSDQDRSMLYNHLVSAVQPFGLKVAGLPERLAETIIIEKEAA